MKVKIEVGQVWRHGNDAINYTITKIENNNAYDQFRVFTTVDEKCYGNISSSWKLINSNQCIHDCCK